VGWCGAHLWWGRGAGWLWPGCWHITSKRSKDRAGKDMQRVGAASGYGFSNDCVNSWGCGASVRPRYRYCRAAGRVAGGLYPGRPLG
jgi:hypothetical protein